MNQIAIALALLGAVAANGAVPVTPPTQAKAPDADKMICKREAVTGSLAQTIKTCHTESEWHQIADQARDDTARLQNASRFTNPQ